MVDDYAHHPTKIRATIAGARQQFGDEVQLVMIHVPHTYSRTKALLPEYRGAFDGLDLLVLGPIEPARERHLEGTVSSDDVAALVTGTGRCVGGLRGSRDRCGRGAGPTPRGGRLQLGARLRRRCITTAAGHRRALGVSGSSLPDPLRRLLAGPLASGALRPDEPLSSHSQFGVGGPADWYWEPAAVGAAA